MARIKTKKQAQGKPKRKGIPWFVWLAIGVSLVATIIFLNTDSQHGRTHITAPEELNAAIIDQLYSLQPNAALIEAMSIELEKCGFQVDYYNSDQVTVDFYRSLPSHGYELLVFRAHSGILGSEQDSPSDITESTFLFTNETYSTTEDVWGQLYDQILPAEMTEGSPRVFAVSSDFVRKSMGGNLKNTVVIMMGCSTAYKTDMACAFIEKGASVYIGWSASVDLQYVDKATLDIIKNLCTEKMTIEQALSKTIDHIGPDPYYNAYPKYYPAKSGNLTIDMLIR